LRAHRGVSSTVGRFSSDFCFEKFSDSESDTVMVGPSTKVDNEASEDEANDEGNFDYREEEFRCMCI
jgi:hypothetical protein